MSDYKVAERLALLSMPERNAFRRKLKETGSVQQLRLYEILLRQIDSGQAADKKKAFARVFEQPWLPDKDYLIRNLFRLLHAEVEAFLLQQVNDESLSIRMQFQLLRRTMASGQYSAFRSDFDALLSRIQAAGDTDAEAELLRIYNEYNMRRHSANTAKLADTSEAMFTELELIRRHYRHQTEALIARHALADWHTRKNGHPLPHMHTSAAEPGNDEVINYFKLLTAALQSDTDMQSELAAKALRSLELANSPLINRTQHELDLHFVMASAALFNKSHHEAAILFDRFMHLPEAESYYALHTVAHEFACCLLHLEQYNDAARILGLYGQNPLHRCFCLLLGNQTEEASAIVKQVAAETNSLPPEAAITALCIKLAQQGAPNVTDDLKKITHSRNHKKRLLPEMKQQLELLTKYIEMPPAVVGARQELILQTEILLAESDIQQQFFLCWFLKLVKGSGSSTLRRL
ncbi:MAG: hypothetical protein MUC87_14900 [Bacteroidia bacterium]|jgi:hypothetical protein|nr:hypothetical protein [Bacteroidia bacterium]